MKLSDASSSNRPTPTHLSGPPTIFACYGRTPTSQPSNSTHTPQPREYDFHARTHVRGRSPAFSLYLTNASPRHPAIRTPLCHSAPGTPESSNDPCHCQGTIPRLPLIYEYGCSVLRRTPELSVTHLSVIPFCSSNPPISSSVTEQLRARRGTPGTGRPSVALTNAPCTTICESF